MSEVVLDASAVLAFINEESGAELVEQYFGDAAIGAANLSEVVAKLVEKGLSDALVGELIEVIALPILLCPIVSSHQSYDRVLPSCDHSGVKEGLGIAVDWEVHQELLL